MKNSLLARRAAVCKICNAFNRLAKLIICFNNLIGIVFNDKFQKIRNIIKMIIKCIAVYMAALNNILYSNFIVRLFIQKLPESIYNSFFSEFNLSYPPRGLS